MTFPDWATLRDHLIEKYASTPHPTAEQEIIDAYELHPAQVEKAALALIDATGITSPWGLLKSKAAKIAAPPSNPTRPSAIDREKQISRAENWIRTTGCHYDRQTEILDELFNDRGLLREYAQIDLIEDTSSSDAKWMLSEPTGDFQLVERMTKQWDQARPAGITIEQDSEARAAKYRAQQAELDAIRAQIEAAREPETIPVGASTDPTDPDADLPL